MRDRYETILDRIGSPISVPKDKHNRRVEWIRRRRMIYRQFVIDIKCRDWIERNMQGLMDVAEAQSNFALPPFPDCYVDIPNSNYGIVLSEGGQMDVLVTNKNMITLPFSVDFITGEGFEDYSHMAGDKIDQMAAIAYLRRQLGFFFLLLHKPKALQITERPMHSAITRGKRRVYLAHSTVSIDILAAEETRKTALTGYRGPYRAHEVRGTWVNYARNRECDHDWQAVEVEDDIPRYFCKTCSQRRSWRRHHVKGDASLGWVRHDRYEVTAKGAD